MTQPTPSETSRMDILAKIESTIATLNETKQALDQQWTSLAQEINRIKQFEMKLSQFRENQKEKIKINVGGTVFCTTRRTMLKEPGSMLAAMFSGNFSIEPDSDGEYFIDRSPKYFPIILEFLRDSTLDSEISRYDSDDLDHLLKELDYYGLDRLIELIRPTIATLESTSAKTDESSSIVFLADQSGSRIVISKNGREARYASSSPGWNGTAQATKCRSWRVRLVDNCPNIMVGMANSNIHREGNNYRLEGWYLYIQGGSLYSNRHSADPFMPGTTFVPGMIIEARYDVVQGTLSFGINGSPLKVAFVGLVGDLHPTFDFYNAGSVIELV
eukprot:TRINITY_DN10474_c0_g1_i1.p1 TRINITY_DN10474_c0_g1~~TRINITY_DN10474_c0_g1_i1.p1  ORF type:complete len:341 (-),score=43.15 TRINITY_DN10474_c0_g1_i1:36-1025(-)